MEFSAKQIADLIAGRVEGNEEAKINDFAKIEEGKEGAISFLSNPKYTHYIYDTIVKIYGKDILNYKIITFGWVKHPNVPSMMYASPWFG